MEAADHLNEYKRFFSKFAATVNPEDQLPVKIGGYSLCDPELSGEIVDWILQYLEEKGCPSSLIPALTKIVVDGIRQVIASQPSAYRRDDNTYQPVKLMQAVTAKVNEVCLGFESVPDNELPAPAACCLPMSACAVKNTRRRMEDRHTVVHDFHGLFNVRGGGHATYYGVFDGHAGTDAAVYSASHLHQFLAESAHYPAEPVLAIRDAFLKTDQLFVEKCVRDNVSSGTTALCALLRHDERMLHVGWAGDSQALLVSRGRPRQLVRPHKPDREDERKRIEDCGGCVIFWGMWRVNGQLAVSRAIGDHDYKPSVTAEPDIVSVPLNDDQDFLILACDGLWDYVSEQEAIVSVYNTIRRQPGNLEAVSQSLVQLSKEQGSVDNISVIVVFLTDPAVLASLDVWPTVESEPVDTMDDALVNTNGSSEPTYEKSNLLLDLDVAGDKLKQAGAASPSATDLYFLNRPANGKDEAGYDDDDFGPETDVDGVDDVLLSPAIAAAKAAALASELDELQRQQTSEFDPVGETREETPTPPADDVAGGTPLVPETDNVAESGEESEDEWNYYRVEPTEKPAEPTVVPTDQQPEEDDNMESRLNPNAAEFVPSPTGVMPSMEEVLSMSPFKSGMPMDDIRVPTPREFQEEVSQRPAGGIDNLSNNPFGDVHFNSGIPDFGHAEATTEFNINSSHDFSKNEPENGEILDVQNPFGSTDQTFSELEVSNNTAYFGDESTNYDYQNTSFVNINEADPLNKSMVEADFIATKDSNDDELVNSPNLLGFENTLVPETDSLLNNLHPVDLHFEGASEENIFDVSASSDKHTTEEVQEIFNVQSHDEQLTMEDNAYPKDDELPLSDSGAPSDQVSFQAMEFPPAPLTTDRNFDEYLELDIVPPHSDIVKEQDDEVTSGVQQLTIDDTAKQPTSFEFEQCSFASVEESGPEQPLFNIVTDAQESAPQPESKDRGTDSLEDFLNLAPPTVQEKEVESANVEQEGSVDASTLPVEIAATGAVLAAAAVTAAVVAKTGKPEGATKAPEKKSDKPKAASSTKPVPGTRNVTASAAVKSPLSPTKPLSSTPQAAPRAATATKKASSPAASRVTSKASPAGTKTLSSAVNKVSSSVTNQARATKTTTSSAVVGATKIQIAAKTAPAKTAPTTARTRPSTSTTVKLAATEKKPALSNGDAKAPIKRPEPLASKKMIPATTAASKLSTRPASAPAATKITKTSTITRTTPTASAATSNVPSKSAATTRPAAKPAVNGVSKPKTTTTATTTSLTSRPKTTVVAKTTVVDKQGKEIANKQLSQTGRSTTVTRTTTSSTVTARKVASKTAPVTTTTSKAGGPIKRPTGTTTTTVTKTTTKVGDAPLEEKVVVIEEFTGTVNKDDSPIVDNAQSEVHVSTD